MATEKAAMRCVSFLKCGYKKPMIALSLPNLFNEKEEIVSRPRLLSTERLSLKKNEVPYIKLVTMRL